MNIREELLAEHSKRQTMKVVGYIDGDAGRFKELMQCFLGPVYRVSQRAAWAVNYCAEHHPELVKPYFGKLMDQLDRDDAHVAVRRNVARMLQFVEIPKRYHGRAFDACYALVDDPTETIAVRVFAMSVAARIAAKEPDLFAELRVMVSRHLANSSTGFRSRANRVLAVK